MDGLSSPEEVFNSPQQPVSRRRDLGSLARMEAINSTVSDRHGRSSRQKEKTEAKPKGPHRISTGGTVYLYAKKRR